MDAFVAELKEVLRCVSANQASPILSGDLARDAIILSHKQAESVQKRRLVRI